MKNIIFKHRTFRFTLIELIVSMAVFTLLSMVVIQLFAATQKLWSRSEGKNELYQDAQMTLDLMSNMLNNISHATTEEQGTQFFRVDNDKVKDSESSSDSFTHFSKLYFATKSTIDALPKSEIYQNPIRFVTFQVVEISNSGDPDNGRNCLVMRVLSDNVDDETKFVKYFPPAQSDNEDLTDELDNGATLKTEPKNQKENVVRLLNNVVAFRVRLGNSSSSLYKQTNNNDYESTGSAAFGHDSLPAFVEITLQLMDLKHYDDYMMRFEGELGSSEAREYRAQHSHTFRRYVYFGTNRGIDFPDDL